MLEQPLNVTFVKRFVRKGRLKWLFATNIHWKFIKEKNDDDYDDDMSMVVII